MSIRFSCSPTATLRLSVTLLSIWLGACSDAAAPISRVPSQPTPITAPTPGLLELNILLAPASLQLGSTSQLRAVTRAQDGRFQDVTEEATWESSDARLCAVTQTGVVEGRGAGVATIAVRYSTLSSSVTIACGYVISALVHENAPTADVAIPEARLEIMGGTLDGRTFQTDASGRVTLPPVSGPGFFIYIKKGGYDDTRLDIFELPRQASIDVELLPAPVRRFARTGDCFTGVFFDEPPYFFTTHRRSRVRITGQPGAAVQNLCVFVTDAASRYWLRACGSSGLDEILPAGGYAVSYAKSATCGTGARWGIVVEHAE